MTEENKSLPEVSFTLKQMKEQASVIFNIINEIRPILNGEENDTAKLNRICNLIGLMYGTADYTVKKMMEDKKDSVSVEDIMKYGDEYIDFFKKANAEKLKEE